MTHVLVIGNSHTAALRAALGTGRSQDPLPWRDMRLTFAAGFGTSSGGLRFEDEAIVAADAEAARTMRWICGIDRFHLPAADAVVICGGLLAPHSVIRLWNAARWFPLPSAAHVAGTDLSLVSEAAAHAALAGAAEQALLFPILSALHAWGRRPLFVLQGVRMSREAVGSGKKMLGATRIHRSGEAEALSALYDAVTLAAHESRARVILQPPDTRADHFFTDSAFCRGATRLSARPDEPQPEDDFLHANAAYGARMLDLIGDAVRGLATPGPVA